MDEKLEESPRFIVAEIGTNWERGRGRAISGIFERLIAKKLSEGYILHSFQVDRMMTSPDTLNETIIAVFQLEVYALFGAELGKHQ